MKNPGIIEAEAELYNKKLLHNSQSYPFLMFLLTRKKINNPISY